MAVKDTVTRILITAKDEASGVFTSFQRHAGKIALAVAGYFGIRLFGDSVKQAEALDVQMRKLEATIEATGGAAGLTAQDIDAMARRLDEATLGSAEGFRKAAGELLTFKSVGVDAFETTLELAQDLAEAGFGTLETNAVQLGKALEDPIKGLTALTRSGVTFTAEQQNLIRSLVETGRAAEAQGLILDAVAGQVGGVARAAGTGLSGALDLVKKRFTDIKEQLGSAVLPVFQRFNERLADLYKRLTDSGAVATFGEAIASAMDAAQQAFFRFSENFDLDAIINGLKSWATTTKESVESVTRSLATVPPVVKAAFGSISTGISTIKAAFFGVSSVVASFVQGLLQGVAKIQEGFAKVTFGDVSARFRQAADEIRQAADSFGESARVNADKARDALADATEKGERLRDTFGELVGSTDDLGTSAEQAAQAVQQVGEQATLTADQLDAMGDGFEFVDGAARKAAPAIAATGKAAADVADDLMAAESAALALEDAYKTLGITSQAALEQVATKARAAFEAIRDSGTASANQIKQAFTAYAERAIAANDGVASAVLKAGAATFGLKLEADETGKIIVQSMREAAQATGEIGEAAKDSANGMKDLIDAVREVKTEVENINKLEMTGQFTSPLNKLYEEAFRIGGQELRSQLEEIYKFRARSMQHLEATPARLGQIMSEMDAAIEHFQRQQELLTRDVQTTTRHPTVTRTDTPTRSSGMSAPSITIQVMDGRSTQDLARDVKRELDRIARFAR